MCQNAFGVLTHPSASFGPAVATTTYEIITTYPGDASTTNAPLATRREHRVARPPRYRPPRPTRPRVQMCIAHVSADFPNIVSFPRNHPFGVIGLYLRRAIGLNRLSPFRSSYLRRFSSFPPPCRPSCTRRSPPPHTLYLFPIIISLLGLSYVPIEIVPFSLRAWSTPVHPRSACDRPLIVNQTSKQSECTYNATPLCLVARDLHYARQILSVSDHLLSRQSKFTSSSTSGIWQNLEAPAST